MEKTDVLNLRDELEQTKASLSSWQNSWKQAKEACDAWKKEAEDNNCRAKGEKEEAVKTIDEVREGLEFVQVNDTQLRKKIKPFFCS